MVIEYATKAQVLDTLDRLIDQGQYSMDEKQLAELRGVRSFVDFLNILDGD
jgi:hypothetical protein